MTEIASQPDDKDADNLTCLALQAIGLILYGFADLGYMPSLEATVSLLRELANPQRTLSPLSHSMISLHLARLMTLGGAGSVVEPESAVDEESAALEAPAQAQEIVVAEVAGSDWGELGGGDIDPSAAAASEEEELRDSDQEGPLDEEDAARAAELELERDQLLGRYMNILCSALARDAESFDADSLATTAHALGRLSRYYIRRVMPSSESAAVRALRGAELQAFAAVARECERRGAPSFSYQSASRLLSALARAFPDQIDLALQLGRTLEPALLGKAAESLPDFNPGKVGPVLASLATLRYDIGLEAAEWVEGFLLGRMSDLSALDILETLWAMAELGYWSQSGDATAAPLKLADALMAKMPIFSPGSGGGPVQETEAAEAAGDLDLTPQDATLFCWALAVLGLSRHPVFETLALRIRFFPRGVFGGDRLFEARDIEFRVQSRESIDSLRRLLEIETLLRIRRPQEGAVRSVGFVIPRLIRQRALLAIGSVDPGPAAEGAPLLARKDEERQRALAATILPILSVFGGVSELQRRRLFSGGHVLLFQLVGSPWAIVPVAEDEEAINNPTRPVGSPYARFALMLWLPPVPARSIHHQPFLGTGLRFSAARATSCVSSEKVTGPQGTGWRRSSS